MDVRELESLIFIASLILRKCFPRQKLPANANKTTLLYKLPQSDFHTPFGLSKGNQGANTCQGSYIYWAGLLGLGGVGWSLSYPYPLHPRSLPNLIHYLIMNSLF